MGFRAGSDKGMSGRYSTGRTESVGVELGISMERTSFKWKRNQPMCVEFLASGKWCEGY